MPALKLISFETCPYVERSRIVLAEKKAAYEIEFIDLKNKPEWFLKVSPRGRVPVLLVDGTPIFESSVINELLEDLVPAPEMRPLDPIARARMRAWIVLVNEDVMAPFGSLLFAKEDAAKAKAIEALRAGLAKLEEELGDRPFFGGERISLVDASLAPLMNRWELVTEMAGDLLSDLPRLRAYAKRIVAQPSVSAARVPDLIPKMRASLAARRG